MAWPFNGLSAREPMATGSQMLADRTGQRRGRGRVDRTQALAHSAVWACRRLRADLISSMPVDLFRTVSGGLFVNVPKPPILVSPDGGDTMFSEFLYASQNDLDDYGNAISIIRARDGLGFPSVLEPVDASRVVVRVRNRITTYVIDNVTYQKKDIWHEKQFPVSGSPVGLSPMAAAAASLSGYLSAQQFAADWFAGNTVPNAILRNTKKTLETDEADVMKSRFKASQQNGDIFVTGADWDYQLVNAQTAAASFLEERQFGIGDVCRFWGVPGDMIGAETSSGSITYANVTQRNLQLLIMNIGPAVKRREDKFSQLTPAPRFVKLNADALLRMDLKSRYDGYKVAIDGRFLAPSEARELENRAPFTPDQLAEFAALFPNKATAPATTPTGVPA